MDTSARALPLATAAPSTAGAVHRTPTAATIARPVSGPAQALPQTRPLLVQTGLAAAPTATPVSVQPSVVAAPSTDGAVRRTRTAQSIPDVKVTTAIASLRRHPQHHCSSVPMGLVGMASVAPGRISATAARRRDTADQPRTTAMLAASPPSGTADYQKPQPTANAARDMAPALLARATQVAVAARLLASAAMRPKTAALIARRALENASVLTELALLSTTAPVLALAIAVRLGATGSFFHKLLWTCRATY